MAVGIPESPVSAPDGGNGAPSESRRADVEYPVRLFTIADLESLPSELPSGPVLYELDNGRLLTMPPAGDIHGSVETKFAGALLYDGERQGFGKVCCGEVGIVLWRNPDRVVGADVAFIANSSSPIRRSPEGYLETISSLITEVRSKNDTLTYIQRKVEDYLAASVQVVWVADPQTKTVTEYRRDREPKEFGENDVLTMEDLIPGFQLPVRQVFAE